MTQALIPIGRVYSTIPVRRIYLEMRHLEKRIHDLRKDLRNPRLSRIGRGVLECFLEEQQNKFDELARIEVMQ